MFRKEDLSSAVVVYNPWSRGKTIDGIPFTKRLTDALNKKIGPMQIFTFEDALTHPHILTHNIISVGGDGTHTTLFKRAAEHNPYGWILTIDGGTLGGIPKSLGLGRTPHENADAYANRVINLLSSDALGKRNFTPGSISWKSSSEPFIMMTGVGFPWSYALAQNERQRRRNAHKIARLWRVGMAFFSVLQNAPTYELQINNQDPILVKNMLIVKAPKKNF